MNWNDLTRKKKEWHLQEIKNLCGSRPMLTVTRREMEGFIREQIETERWTQATANGFTGTIRGLWKTAAEFGYLEQNPMRSLTWYSRSDVVPEALTDEQVLGVRYAKMSAEIVKGAMELLEKRGG